MSEKRNEMHISANWKTVNYKNIKVYYLPQLDGGGRAFGQDFVPVVKELFGKVDSICEFASGPGFIGFSLLSYGLCNKLYLVDVNPSAIQACKKTIKENHLQTSVRTYVSDVLDDVPKKEMWDLIVSNPPHFAGSFSKRGEDILLLDPNWKMHKKFYSSAKEHLTKKGYVLFIENSHGSSPETFQRMIKKGGLVFVKSFQYKHNFIEVVFQNLRVILHSINVGTLKRVFGKKMVVRTSKILSVGDYPLYFVLSKNI